MRVRFGLEVVGAVCALVLAIVTLLSRDWMEVVFGVNPDHGSGALEWAVVFAFAAISIGLTLAARQQWQRLRVPA
jgi:NADH:ubiquinone oxidoreductase subunit 6 (subunit J)